MKAYRKKIKRKDVYRQFLVLTNSLLKFTDRELDVLSLLLQIQEDKSDNILSTVNRRFIMKETRVNKNNLSKYIKKMKSMGVVLKDEKGYYINNKYIPVVDNGLVELLFVLEIKDDENQNIT